MNIIITNPVTNEKHKITVALSVPCASVKMAIESIIDTFPADVQAEYGRNIIAAINRTMKNNAIADVVFSKNIFAALAQRVTYGKYAIHPGESGTGYTLDSFDIADKIVKVINPKTGKKEDERRKAFVTYADCVRYVKAMNTENKKNGAALYTIPGDFGADAMRKIRYFILAANGRLTEENKAMLTERGADYAPFLEDKDSNNGKKARVQVFYDIFNAATGKNVKAIHHVENNVVKECTTYNSMYKLDKDSNETAYISALFNEWLNSEMVTATAYRAKKPEAAKKGKKKTAETAKTKDITIESGSVADNWCIEKMQETGCNREQAEKLWFEVMDAIS